MIQNSIDRFLRELDLRVFRSSIEIAFRDDIEMHIAVPDMSIGNRETIRKNLGQFPFSFIDERCQFRQWNRYVSAQMLATQRLPFIHRLPEHPEILTLCPR